MELWQEIALQHGKARQMAFSRALRAELQRICDALPEAKALQGVVRPTEREESHAKSAAKSARSASAYVQSLPQSPTDPEAPKEDVSLRHVDVQKDEDRFATNPWMGASRLMALPFSCLRLGTSCILAVRETLCCAPPAFEAEEKISSPPMGGL